MLDDSQQRIQATDPSGSFIVQAPAGSGKTELLTQRFLRLLSGVNAPEQIVALTFTRKAANEMRKRILLALQQAADQQLGNTSHQKQTLAFAKKALERDQQLNWQLIQQPSRLRIITIDSLCQTLVHAIPLQEKQLPYANISDKATQHYQSAAHACLSYAITTTAYQQPIKILLQHVDNRQDLLLDLFSDLLATREQWLSLIYQAKSQDQTHYEQALSWILDHELARFKSSIPINEAEELIQLVRKLACINIQTDYPYTSLKNWHHVDELDRQKLQCLATLLLTSQNTLRKAFDHHVGLKRGECDDNEYTELKRASQTLLKKLTLLPGFLAALLRVKELPAPHYNSEQWQVLQALLTLLPLLAAHLHVQFSEHNEVDFTAISEQALLALGDAESPTNLALYLDHSIHHLLVDEFQDTSIQQFHLLSKLVQEWQPNDGKTLFIVGDPMQSIYRFRAAEVGLFLRAQQQGIGPVHLTPIELTSNFRSSAPIVDWVNQQFSVIFPPQEDIESGAVSFHCSRPCLTATEQSFVKAFAYHDRQQEAEALVAQVITELKNYPNEHIAILVRSRQQLIDIIRCLRFEKIPFQGIEIDLLSTLPHLRDVWILTQALLMPANRLVWLALLRSPWCGLSLQDLLCVARFESNKSIYSTLKHLGQLSALSNEGQHRVRYVFAILEKALAKRHQQPLIEWLVDTVKQLHGEDLLDSVQKRDLEQYWLLLGRFTKSGQIEDLNAFSTEFNKLYSQQVVPSRLQIMTIHKSKGLEFDCVFLPGLNTKPLTKSTPLLRWLKLPSKQQEELILLSPIKAAHHEYCLLYNYLGMLDAQKNSYESQRLLYVATTRAKKRLYLFDNSDKVSQGTFRHLLSQQAFVTPETTLAIAPVQHNFCQSSYLLPIDYYQQIPPMTDNVVHKKLFSNINPTPRVLGIVTHELLQWVCNHHPKTLEEIPWTFASYQLQTFGFTETILASTLAHVKDQITQMFHDPIGQWLINAHEKEQNEYELLVATQNDYATKIIDRTFFENGERWVIDFKTGHDDVHAVSQHQQQVNDYAKLFAKIENNIIRCGLYYLTNNNWVTWEYLKQ